MLLGVALFYGFTGSTGYDHILLALNMNFMPQFLITLTLLFKLGAAPLHTWAPDLYDSIPTEITVYMVVIPKLAVLGFLMVIYDQLESLPFTLIGAISLVVGSVGLVGQWRIKRFLAYSAISNLGFLLLTLGTHHSY
jgi:NADH-quinone oxidoreductase subunit N